MAQAVTHDIAPDKRADPGQRDVVEAPNTTGTRLVICCDGT